jgi:hypothetical protein
MYYLFSDENMHFRKKLAVLCKGILLSSLVVLLSFVPFLEGCHTLRCFLSGFLTVNNINLEQAGLLPSVILNRIGLPHTLIQVTTVVTSWIIAIKYASKNKILESVYVPLVIPVIFGSLWFQPWYLLWSIFLFLPRIRESHLLGLCALLVFTSYYFLPLYVSSLMLTIYLIGFCAKKWLPRYSLTQTPKENTTVS